MRRICEASIPARPAEWMRAPQRHDQRRNPPGKRRGGGVCM